MTTEAELSPLECLPEIVHATDDDGAPPLRLRTFPYGVTVEVRRSGAVIGRHSEADIRLPLNDVSRKHCRLDHDDGQWRVTDLRSTNGIHVNGRKVASAALRPGDSLKIGAFEFEVAAASDLADSFSPEQKAVLRGIAGRLLPASDARRAG